MSRHRKRHRSQPPVELAEADQAPELTSEHEPTFSLNREIARARREMGEATWNRLQAEWEQ